ncbi:MAG: ribosome biogenesis GTPase Der [Clostridiales bacterium]|nr:ribosome biogenesis GTPase Der [Clostridiales bacterium]
MANKKPIVAIVGRQNVDKSTLFNVLAGRRIGLVEDTPGITRDRIYTDATWLNLEMTIIDTVGIEPENEEIIAVQMPRQAELAIETADVIVFMTDGREGITAADDDVARILRKSKKPIVLVVNKVDAPKFEDSVFDFYSLGIGEPITISGAQKLGLGDMLDAVVSHFPPWEEMDVEAEENKIINIAVVGKPNVGKSSIINAILGTERTIVSDIPGTTRDSIDTPFTKNGQEYVIVDTAGLRRKRAIEDETIERYSVIRSLSAIRRADVVLVVVDASEELSEQDVRIAGYAHEEGRASILVVNKWDLIEKDTNTMNEFKKRLKTDLAFMSYVPMLFVSAKTKQRLHKMFDEINRVYEQTNRRITTGTLNDCVSEAVMVKEPPSDKGRRLKIYYATQVAVAPPTFVLFVNDAKAMHFSYQRYLENFFRKYFGLDATPIKLIIRNKNEER